MVKDHGKERLDRKGMRVRGSSTIEDALWNLMEDLEA
jgi:hypothetical protein